MNNLLEETKRILQKTGHTLSDIVWVGCEDYRIEIDQFIELADVVYDDGYGSEEVATDLLVVGADWWLERHKYDGSEWWEYKTIPQMPEEVRSVDRVVATDRWGGTLTRINEEDE
jgi:hypothetical protein